VGLVSQKTMGNGSCYSESRRNVVVQLTGGSPAYRVGTNIEIYVMVVRQAGLTI
jgi:hypothetical protein